MGIGKVRRVYFSPTGTTRRIVAAMAEHFPGAGGELDLGGRAAPEITPFASDELAIVGIPVFSGRVPEPIVARLKRLSGANNPAIAVAVYGNRHYDDALLELHDTLQQCGFSVIAAAACIARHSIFPQVAHDRPDAEDLAAIAAFARRCRAKLEEAAASGAQHSPLAVKGMYPYRDIQTTRFRPSIDDRCVGCGACVAVCPTQALQASGKGKKPVRDNALCIACTACIATCPTGAQAFRDEHFAAAGKAFAEKMQARREAEFFV